MNEHWDGIGFTSQRTRERLIQRLRAMGIRDERVLTAMLNIPRHVFVDEALASRAYEDTALPIGHSQTISQPYIVARMTEALLAGRELRRVLEIGSGSGYQTTILAALVDEWLPPWRAGFWVCRRLRCLSRGARAAVFPRLPGSSSACSSSYGANRFPPTLSSM